MFGDDDALVQIDMSEYMEKHNVSRLIGAPPGYVGYEEGGQLTEKIRRRPYAVVLLDEIEKGHPDVFNMLLQIMEEGHLTDSFGRKVDFRNVIMIMTSNIGADLIKGGAQTFGLAGRGSKANAEDSSYEKMKELLMKEIERFFRPEFIGRLDDVIVFRPLTKVHLTSIIDLELSKVRARLNEHDIQLDIAQEAKDFLIEKGTSSDFGARPLRRAIEQFVEDPLSEEILRGNFRGKHMVKVGVKMEGEEKKHLTFDSEQVVDDVANGSAEGTAVAQASDAT